VTWHRCTDCAYKAKDKDKRNLKKHRADVHDEDVTWHQSEDCEYQAKQKGNLKIHRERKHKNGKKGKKGGGKKKWKKQYSNAAAVSNFSEFDVHQIAYFLLRLA
jgi:hypothetical protein